MKIRIINDKSFKITEQGGSEYFETQQSSTPIGKISVAQSCYPEVRYMDNKITVFVRGIYKHMDNNVLKVNKPEHLGPILEALEKFCTFNEEPFEIEPCIL
jgi:hypothetical protein